MKKTTILSLLMAIFCLCSCSDDPIDSLNGTYNLDRYVFTSATVNTTTKLKKGIKSLNVTLKNDNNSAELSLGSTEWTLAAGTFTPAAAESVAANGEYTLTVDGQRKAVSGDLDVTLVDSTYYINGLLTDASGSRFMVDYKGPLSFVIGVDDPEASGYTFSITESTVTDANGTTYDGLTKYVITVSDPSGVECAAFYPVAKSGLDIKDLVGTYTIQGYPTAEGLMDQGWVVYYPEYYVEMAGGTYFTDANGVKQYVNAGSITISYAEDSEGNPLYSFSGSGLSTLTAQNVAGSGASVKIQYATYIKAAGTIFK